MRRGVLLAFGMRVIITQFNRASMMTCDNKPSLFIRKLGMAAIYLGMRLNAFIVKTGNSLFQ